VRLLPPKEPHRFQVAPSKNDPENSFINKNTAPNTVFDFAFGQFYENAAKFGFGTMSDNVYRYIQGALINFQQNGSPFSMHTRFWSGYRTVLFPEWTGIITDLVYVENTQPGTVLGKYGVPVVVKVRPVVNLNDRKVRDQNFRLPSMVETEANEFIVLIFEEKQNRRDATVQLRSTVSVGDQTQNLFHDVFGQKVTGEKFKNLLSRKLWSLYARYGRGRHVVVSHMLGKPLVPGPGAACYLVEAAASAKSDQQRSTSDGSFVWLMLIRNTQSLMIGFNGANVADAKTMLPVLINQMPETPIRNLYLFEVKYHMEYQSTTVFCIQYN